MPDPRVACRYSGGAERKASSFFGRKLGSNRRDHDFRPGAASLCVSIPHQYLHLIGPRRTCVIGARHDLQVELTFAFGRAVEAVADEEGFAVFADAADEGARIGSDHAVDDKAALLLAA